MNKIYIIENCFFQDSMIIAAFSTKKKADEYLTKIKIDGSDDYYITEYDDYYITEYDIDPNYPDKS